MSFRLTVGIDGLTLGKPCDLVGCLVDPNPIREAFLLNSDLEEATVVAAGTNGFDEAGSFSA